MCRSATFFECAFGVPSSGASRHLPPTRKAKQEAALKNPVASHRETIIRPYGALATVHRKVASRRRLARGGSAAFYEHRRKAIPALLTAHYSLLTFYA